MKNKKLGIAVTVIIVTAFLVIVAVIARIAIGNRETNKDVTTVIQTDGFTVTGENETDIPAITEITKHDEETTVYPVGDINVDVVSANEENENNNEPEIVGGVVVIPGIKE